MSGLTNPNFLKAAADSGIRYLITDTSKLTANPPPPNTGIRDASQPTLLQIPRRPTNIFYNTTSPVTGAGSLPDEYNYFYGPQGLFRVTGTNAPFFAANQTYADIVDREATTILGYMLGYEAFPLMFHQSNLSHYTGTKSLFSDVIGAALSSFSKISNLPVISLSQSGIGSLLEHRMDYNASGVKATLTPGIGITVSVAKGARISITGICASQCESYGGQNISHIVVGAGQSVTVPTPGAGLVP